MENNIEIVGFRADVHNVPEVLNLISDICPQGTIQILRTDGLAGKRHLMHATMQAILSFKRKTNFAQDLGLEICLRASAQRQISRALNILGIKEGKQDLCAVMVDCPQGSVFKLEKILGKRNNSVLQYIPENLKKIYKISDVEIDACNGVQNVLIEKTTLLNLEN
ncbi:MAG TPA: KEOPS complex subunit Cgi121 [Methanobacteriaceae archaeon]|nr:KEOPS complex subunit Cgi121 [Methanobacteriaceae archaeon]